jgi:ABC-type antimicrobial peptide transport system permease subunit
LFGEKVRGIVHPLNHRHVTFTIPKLLRGYLRRNRRLGKLLLRSAWQAWHEYLRELLQIRDGLSAAGSSVCRPTAACSTSIPMFMRWCFPGLFGKDVFMN